MRIPYEKCEKLLKRGEMVRELTLEGDIICSYKGKQYTASYAEDRIKLKKTKPQIEILTLKYEWDADD